MAYPTPISPPAARAARAARAKITTLVCEEINERLSCAPDDDGRWRLRTADYHAQHIPGIVELYTRAGWIIDRLETYPEVLLFSEPSPLAEFFDRATGRG